MKRQLSCITLATLLLLAGHSLADAIQTREAKFSDLTFTIATTKKNFLRLEPIPIVLTLSNETRQPITGHSALEFSDHHVKMSVIPEGGEARVIRQLSPVAVLIVVPPQNIGPGARLQSKDLLTLDLDEIFPNPGTYHLQATLTDGKEEIKSNLLEVEIGEPTGLNRRAFNYIKSKASKSRFFSGLEMSSEENLRGTLEEFVSKFGESEYGDNAAFLLGQVYFADEEYDKAIEQFRKVSKKPEFGLTDKAAEKLAQAEKLKASKPTEQE